MIETKVEKARKCGLRKPGGIYLVSDGELGDCGRLPIPLTACPTCGGGFHAARGWTWVDGRAILGLATPECKCLKTNPVIGCPLRPGAEMIGDRVGLLWIGESFYPTTEEYCQEAREQGISRRLAHLPQKFRLGLTYVFLAHRKGMMVKAGSDTAADLMADSVWTPAIFGVFKPSRVEYVVKGDETEEQIAAIEKRGWTAVKVVHEAEDEAL